MKQDGNVPFTARSVLASALLGEVPAELPVSHLVHLAGLFGINENRARVALSRMASSGEVTTDGSGRYRLAGHLLERQDRQVASRRGESRRWEGAWRLVVVAPSGGAADERQARRKRLTRARLAELREGVWLRPDNIDLVPDPAPDPLVTTFTADPDGDAAALAGRLWDLAGWAQRARDMAGRLEELPPTGPDDLAPGFELSAAVLRHLQADPLLPEALLPADWPGPALRRTYDHWDRRYREVLTTWGRAV
jgi:phenylacetic acid degradation operon negative regulatory protein